MTQWTIAFNEWKQFAAHMRARAQKIDTARQEIGWKLAESAGIPRDACCLHNASIDDDLRGWCFQNPERLAVAKRANYLVNQWEAHKIASRAIAKKWNSLLVPLGACPSTVE